MITVRRAGERHHERYRKQDAWYTFSPMNNHNPVIGGFGSLELLSEEHIPPAATARAHAQHDSEILTYVREGALAFEDSSGRSGVIHAGEFQRMTAGHRLRHSEMNASRNATAHVFRIWLRSSEVELKPSHEQKRFSIAQRRGLLCVIASPDGRRGSLQISQQAIVYSSLLEAGHHVVQEILSGRSAWLHVVHGEVTVHDLVLSAGDGAGHTAERAVSVTAREGSEILLIDLGGDLSNLQG